MSTAIPTARAKGIATTAKPTAAETAGRYRHPADMCAFPLRSSWFRPTDPPRPAGLYVPASRGAPAPARYPMPHVSTLPTFDAHVDGRVGPHRSSVVTLATPVTLSELSQCLADEQRQQCHCSALYRLDQACWARGGSPSVALSFLYRFLCRVPGSQCSSDRSAVRSPGRMRARTPGAAPWVGVVRFHPGYRERARSAG